MERKPCRLTLCTPDDEVLERWSVEYDGKNGEAHDLSRSVARDEVMGDITQELRRYQLKTHRETHREKAVAIWQRLSHGEKHGVLFGLFPLPHMRVAEGEGYDGKDLARALMSPRKTRPQDESSRYGLHQTRSRAPRQCAVDQPLRNPLRIERPDLCGFSEQVQAALGLLLPELAHTSLL